MNSSKFIFTLDDSNSFCGLFENKLTQKEKQGPSKMIDQECTRSSLFYQVEKQRNIKKNYKTPVKQSIKERKKEIKYYPIFRNFEKCQRQQNETESEQIKVIKLSRRIKKKISLLQVSNAYSPIKIYSKKDSQTEINERQRLKLYDWLMQVCQVLEFSRQTYHKCLNLFQKINKVKKSKAQLTATTCLYMISKLEQNSQRIETFSQITEQFCKIEDIRSRELQIMMELKFKINSQTVYTIMQDTIVQWDQFLQKNPNIINFNVEKFKMIGMKLQAIKNNLQLNVFIDYLRMHRVTNFNDHRILVICGIYIIIGLDIGQFTFQNLQHKLRMSNYTLTNNIVFRFVKQYFRDVSILDVQTCLTKISSKCTILKRISEIYEKVMIKLEENKFVVYKQLHFNNALD